METLTKENFWDEMEQKYPKAMAHFKKWIDQYKQENHWAFLFNGSYHGDLCFTNSTTENCPKYHELPVAMQFGIFIEHLYSIEPITGEGSTVKIRINLPKGDFIGKSPDNLGEWMRKHLPNHFEYMEGKL